MTDKRTWLWLWMGLIAGVVVAASGALPVPTTNVMLAWNGVPSVSGYKVYYGPASRNYTNFSAAGNVTNATVSGLVKGATYYFAVTSLSAAGMESGYSGEAMATAGSTNIYLIVSVPLYDRHFNVQGTTTLAVGWTNSGYSFVVRDAVGVIGGKAQYYTRLLNTSNIAYTTNTIIETNPPPDTGMVQVAAMPFPLPTR